MIIDPWATLFLSSFRSPISYIVSKLLLAPLLRLNLPRTTLPFPTKKLPRDLSDIRGLNTNYGHDDFSIALLRDTTPHVEIQQMNYGAKNPILWNHARFFHLLRPMLAQEYIKLNICNIVPH